MSPQLVCERRADNSAVNVLFSSNNILGFAIGDSIPVQSEPAPLVDVTVSTLLSGSTLCLQQVVRCLKGGRTLPSPLSRCSGMKPS